MKIFEWSKEYSVEIDEMDNHHQRLFDILNKLFTLMIEGGASDKQIIRVIEELLDYTRYHFDEEEKIMAKMGYPELNTHRNHHQVFINQMKEFHTSSENGMAIFVATKVANVGTEWLKNHIMNEDRQYTHYMKKQGL
jgi:hemerythrin-like metal-binding protein